MVITYWLLTLIVTPSSCKTLPNQASLPTKLTLEQNRQGPHHVNSLPIHVDGQHDLSNSTHVRSRRSVCSRPSLYELRSQWMEYQLSEARHPSYFMLPQYQDYIQHELDKSSSPNQFVQYGDIQCPKSVSELANKANVQDQSLCPWYNVVNYDPDRYPVELVEARCKCSTCIGVDSASGAGCQPLYYNVPVLRRSNTCLTNGRYKYDKGWQKILVGCTCAMSHTK